MGKASTRGSHFIATEASECIVVHDHPGSELNGHITVLEERGQHPAPSGVACGVLSSRTYAAIVSFLAALGPAHRTSDWNAFIPGLETWFQG